MRWHRSDTSHYVVMLLECGHVVLGEARGVQEGLKKAVLEPGRDINKVLSSREDGGSVG